MRIVILAAGVGSRLGNPFPKPLTPLADGRTILERQLTLLGDRFDPYKIAIVVGFKKDMILEAHPEVSFVYNQDFGETNTSKSLLKALLLTGDDPVLWLNGDVVFEPELLDAIGPLVDQGDRSFVCVNTERVSDEEVKYRADEAGNIFEISKTVVGADGEAVGINFISAADKGALADALEQCDANDYFERGLEMMIGADDRHVAAVDVGTGLCIEIDFPEDLQRVNAALDAHSNDR